MTALAPVNALPVMVTEAPTGPLVGVKLAIDGGGITVKLLALAAVPAGVVTAIGPLLAPDGTVAVIWVSELNVKLALVPLKVTAVAPVNPVPVIVTEVPTGPLDGEKPVTLSETVKLTELVAVPAAVVIATGPVVAPDGTLAVIRVSESTVSVIALVLLKETTLAAVKPVPVIVTDVPVAPLVGEKLVIVGPDRTSSNAPLSQPVPCGRVVPR